jgi:hypothetical protein
VSVDKGDGAEDLSAKVSKLHDEFVKACEVYNGAYMSA